MAPHSSTLAWSIPGMEESGRLQSMGSLGVGHDWASSLSLFTFMHWRRKWQPTPVFLPGESQGWGSLVAAISGVTQSRTWLKRLSSSTSPSIMLLQAIPFSVKLPIPLSLISLNFSTHYIHYILLILGWSLSYSILFIKVLIKFIH